VDTVQGAGNASTRPPTVPIAVSADPRPGDGRGRDRDRTRRDTVMTESLTEELKRHLAEAHKIVEAFEGMTVSDDVIVYGRDRDHALIVAIHDLVHERD
jgi:hypothetical protein